MKPSVNAALLPHRIHVAFPSLIRRSHMPSDTFFTTLSPASTRTNPLLMLPLPYTTTICVRLEGTGTVSVCAFEPEEMLCSVIVRVLPSSVSFSRASSSRGTLTKEFSSEALHRWISSLRVISCSRSSIVERLEPVNQVARIADGPHNRSRSRGQRMCQRYAACFVRCSTEEVILRRILTM